MRKKIKLHTGPEKSDLTDQWLQLLIQRIILEQLDVSHRLKARMLHQTFTKTRKEEDYFEE